MLPVQLFRTLYISLHHRHSTRCRIMERRYGCSVEEGVSTHQEISLDDDGDLVVCRRRKEYKNKLVMSIQHNITSSIPSVGLQVWRAELVLADFVCHKMFASSEFHGIVAVELGAGTGLVGILLARVAQNVFVTDHGAEVLENCHKNVDMNSRVLPHKDVVSVRELDWMVSWPPRLVPDSISQPRYGWNLSEVKQVHSASLLLAADVIYSDELTDAFFSTLETLMSQGSEKVLYMALEKRYNFTLDDLNVVANGYSRFRSYVRDEGEIPQYVRNYERGEDVELWKIKYLRSKCPEECMEAVSTLMFAAARFADLPELRSLRTLFAKKYGNSLEPYVNHELVKKLKSTQPTKDMKIQLLHEIALEHSMEWDSKALEQKLFKPPPSAPPQNEDNSNELQKKSNPNAWRTVDLEVKGRRRNLSIDEKDGENNRPRGRKDSKNSPLKDKPLKNLHIEVEQKDSKNGSEKKREFGYTSIPPPPYTIPKDIKNGTSPIKEENIGSETNDKLKPVGKSVRRRRSNIKIEKEQEGVDGKDEEERLMDKLLMLYSNKPSSSPNELADQLKELKQIRKKDKKIRTRTNSLPGEASTSSTVVEEDEKKGHVRANSVLHDNEILDHAAHHKPLDYDDFMARFAALRGKEKELESI